jgi:uncharacterized membrane protein YgcG
MPASPDIARAAPLMQLKEHVMKTIKTSWAVAAVLVVSYASAVAAPRVEPLEEPRPDVWAKVANERAKGNAARGVGGGFGSGDGESGCGNVDVGNVDTGGSGAGRARAPRENTVIITGDVINANNRCR